VIAATSDAWEARRYNARVLADPRPSLATLPLFQRLEGCQNVLIAGAGGGFDVFAGLPLYFALRAEGKAVHLANLTFTSLSETDVRWLAPHLAEVTAETSGADRYFPERRLAEWFAHRGAAVAVYAFEKVGVAPLREAYQALALHLAVDALILVDGGTDILMRGDEAGLGTPVEDMSSLAAVSVLDIPRKVVACIGFGIDAFHGVCHAHFLENVAALTREGAFHGAFSVLPSMPEAQAFMDAVDYAQRRTPSRPSIVNGSIVAAVRGDFGDVQFTSRTRGSELFVNPLMSLYFSFDLEGVVRHSLYLPDLENTQSAFDVAARIEAFRHRVDPRPHRPIPH
jgi:hypothetical protein